MISVFKRLTKYNIYALCYVSVINYQDCTDVKSHITHLKKTLYFRFSWPLLSITIISEIHVCKPAPSVRASGQWRLGHDGAMLKNCHICTKGMSSVAFTRQGNLQTAHSGFTFPVDNKQRFCEAQGKNFTCWRRRMGGPIRREGCCTGYAYNAEKHLSVYYSIKLFLFPPPSVSCPSSLLLFLLHSYITILIAW